MSGVKTRTRELNENKATEQQVKVSSNSSRPRGDASSNQAAASLAMVLEEILDFRQDVNKQLKDIKSELTKVDQKVEEVENRVGDVEVCTENMEQVVTKLRKEITQLDNKVLDQKVYPEGKISTPEDAEGTSMVDFVEKLLRYKLEIPDINGFF